MANITETAEWSESVLLLDLTTPVLGGPDGPSNAPLRQLANRTGYLRAEVEKRSLLGHVHAIAGISGLQAILDGKSPTSHTHTPASIGAAPTSHSHAVGDIANLQAALDGKSATSHTHTPASLGAAAAAHTHTTSNITGLDAALAGKAPISHTHGAGDLTALPIDFSATGIGPIGSYQLLAYIPIVRPIRLPNGLAGSIAKARQGPLASVTVTAFIVNIQETNSIEIGTWSFAANSKVPTFASNYSGDYVCAVGEKLVIQAIPTLGGSESTACGIGVNIKASLA